jgi:integrase
MQKGENSNRPAQGSKIKVELIRKLKDVKTVKKFLAHKPLDLALFTVGINTNLRASDLLQIKVKQVKGLKPGENIELREKKTDKIRRITLNGVCMEVIQNLLRHRLRSRRYRSDENFLFTGKRGVLTVPSIHLKVKNWCRQINLKGNYGSHNVKEDLGISSVPHIQTTPAVIDGMLQP